MTILYNQESQGETLPKNIMDLVTMTNTHKVFPFIVLKLMIDAYVNEEIDPKF